MNSPQNPSARQMPPFSFLSRVRHFLPALLVLAFSFAHFSRASTVSVLTPEKIDEMLARLQPGEDTVYVDDMGFKATYLRELRDQLKKLRDSKDGEVTVNSGFLSSASKWTNGIVPYAFDSSVTTTQRQQWTDACRELEQYVKITLVPRSGQANYILVKTTNSNSSYMGMQGGQQILQMVSWHERGVIIHEIMHALGFCHEQSRSDRDTYVTINYGNINSDKWYNFDKETSSHMSTPYDFSSIMHYGSHDFSNNGMPTISAKPAYAHRADEMGNREYLTTYDKQGLAGQYGGPNLKFWKPNGQNGGALWPSEIVLSNAPDTSIDQSTFSQSDTIYLDVAPWNNGSIPIPDSWEIAVYINGNKWLTKGREYSPGPGTNAAWTIYDIPIDITSLAPGTHEIRVVLDYWNDIGETDESAADNERTRIITVASQARSISLSGNLNFGDVEVGQSASRAMTISNTGDSALSVTGINYAAGFSGSWSSGSISAGGSQNVTVTFTPTTAQSYSGSVTVNSNATSGTNTRAISGTGTAVTTRVIALSGDLAFGGIPTGQTATRTLTIGNTGNSPLSVTGISYPAGFSGNNLLLNPIAAGGSVNVIVTFWPEAALSYSGNIIVTSDATSGANTRAASGTGTTSLPSVTTTAAGHIIHNFASTGGNVTSAGGGTVTERGVVYATTQNPTTNSPGKVVSGNGTGSFTSYLTGLAAGTTYYARAYAINSSGPGYGSQISFTTAAQSRIIGLSGDLTFENVATSLTATRTLTIQNTGNSTLSVTGINYPAGFSGNWSSGSIPAGGSQNVTVTFAPTATQSYGGNIIVTSNATSGTNTRAVSGTGSVLVTVLANNQTLENRSGAEDSTSYYVLDVPAGQTLLAIEIFGGNGDCDLYVRQGSLPTLSAWDYFLNMAGNDERVDIVNPASGNYYIMLHGWSVYSDVSLKVLYSSLADLPTVTTASVSGITHNSAIGGGNVTHAGNAGPVTERGFVIATTPDPTNMDGVSVHAGSGIGSFTEYASSLIPSTTYYVKAYAVNSAGKAYGDQVSFTTQAVTRIVALSGDLAFGSVQTGQTATRTLTIQNTGNSTLSVTGISYPAGFTGNWSSGYIGAGDSQNVTVTFTPTAAQNYSGNVTVISNATSGANMRAISGTGTAMHTRIIVLSGDPNFGYVQIGQTAIRTMMIQNTGNSILNVTDISYYPPFTGNWSSGSISPGGSQNVTITFTPTAAQTTYSANLMVTSDATSGSNIWQVVGTGTVAQTRVIGLSGDLAFGSVQAGQSATRTLILQNTGNTALNVTSIGYPTGFSGNWSSGSIPASGSQNVTVTFSPTAAQSYSGNVTVTSDATSGTNTRAVSGTGSATLTRIIALSGDLAFGSVQVGQSATRTLTLQNTGNSALSVTSISYPTGFSGNWSSGSIPASGSQNVTVTFAPTAAQSYSGNLTASSDATSGTNTRAVSGTGTSSITPPNWQTPVGKENSMTVYAQVENAGVRIDAPGSMLAVFQGGVVAGVASPINGPAGLFYQLTVWSNLASVGNLLLKVYDAATGEIHDIKENVNFTANGVLGLINAPVLFTVQPSVVEQVIPLVSGWNWVSFNALPETPTVTTTLTGYTPQDNDLIKGVAGSATYYGGSWFPASFAIEPGRMYMLHRQQAGASALNVTGPPADEGLMLNLVAGWNWLGYIPQDGRGLGAALNSLTLANNDLVKSQQDGTATYFGGQWFPGTVMMQPGRGYLLRLAQAQSFSYDDPTASAQAQMAFMPEASATTSAAPVWQAPLGKENSMTLYAAVQMDGAPVTAAGSLLAAFDGAEVAGVAEVMDGPVGKLFQLTIWSDSAAKAGLTLKVYDPDTETVHDIVETVDFVTNAILGGIATPQVLNTASSAVSEFVFSSHSYVVKGNPNFVGLEITRTGGTAPAGVTLSTSDGSAGVVPPFAAAVAGVDYTALNTVVNFAEGEMSKVVPITLIPRTGALPNRRFLVALSNPTNGAELGLLNFAEVRLLVPDTKSPALAVTFPPASARTVAMPSPFFISGTAGDALGVDRVELEYEGETFTITPGFGGAAKLMAVPWTFEFTPNAEGPVSLTFTAYDLSGNSTTVTRSFVYERRHELTLTRGVPLDVLPDKAGTVQMKARSSKDAALIVKPNFHGIPAAQLPSSWSVKEGAELTLTAAAKTGHLFSHWNGLPEAAQVRGNVAALVIPAEDVSVTAVFVENPLTQVTMAALGAKPVFQGLLRPDETTSPGNDTAGFLSAAIVPAKGSLSGKLWMDGIVTSFTGVLHGDGSVWLKVGRDLAAAQPFAGRELTMTWSESGLATSVTRTVNEVTHVSAGLAKAPRYSRAAPVRGALLDAKGRQGYFTLALPTVTQDPVKLPTEYPQGTGHAGLTLLANGTLKLAGTLAEGTKITAASFLVEGDAAEVFVVLPTPGGKTKAGSLLGTLVFDEAQADTDVTSADMHWFRPVAQTRMTSAQAYRAGWPSGIKLGTVGALYQGTLPVQTALGLAMTGPSGNAELVFQDGKLIGEVSVPLNLDGSRVMKLDAKDKTWSLVLSPRTGLMTGVFAPDWTDAAKRLPSFSGILLQKGGIAGGHGFFLSNRTGDLEPESGSVSLE